MPKSVMCSVCGQPVLDGEARYYFPVLAAAHPLAALKGIAHVACLRREDAALEIGQQLADVRELAARSDATETYLRDGNILVCGRFADEGTVEIYDAEDFCDFSLSLPAAHLLMNGDRNEITTPLMSIAIGERVSQYSSRRPAFLVKLDNLSGEKFKGLLKRFFELSPKRR